MLSEAACKVAEAPAPAGQFGYDQGIEALLHPTFKSNLQQELWFKPPFFEAPFQADLGEEMKIQGFGLMRPTLRGLTI